MKRNKTSFKKGQIPWNKGLKGVQTIWNKGLTKETSQSVNRISQAKQGHEVSEETREKLRKANLGKHYEKDVLISKTQKTYESKKRNHTFNTSKPEEEMYKKLCEEYGVENIRRQYKEERYPYACDFYIPSEDLFIELNFHWTHGGMPYEKDNPQCQEKLKEWEEKAKTNKYYKNAIYTWTDLDVRKQEIAKKNNLNYKIIYKSHIKNNTNVRI